MKSTDSASREQPPGLIQTTTDGRQWRKDRKQEYSTSLAGSGTTHYQIGYRRVPSGERIRAYTTGHGSGADRTAHPTFSTGDQPEGDGRGSDAADDVATTSTGEGATKTSQTTERLLQVWKSPNAKGLFTRQQATVGHYISNGGKRRRSGTGLSSTVTGSSAPK